MNADDDLYDQLEHAMEEASNSRREAFEESVRRGKAERDAVEAIRRAKAAERSYSELEKKLKEQEEVLQQVQTAMESQISEFDNKVKELEKRRDDLEMELSIANIVAAERLKQQNQAAEVSWLTYFSSSEIEEERDDLQIEVSMANILTAEELRQQNQAAETSSRATYLPQYVSEFSLAEIEEATCNFHPCLKIGEGGYGCVYKGQLDHTEVAIKKPHFDDSWQGSLEYQQEVLGKLRHPNLVTLIGTCREVGALVYEYLPNGSLEDRLSCKDNSSPLSWQTRIRIAAELCSVLVFLHSSKPHSIVHGDLIPDNILLDANLVSKLSGFGSSRVISHDDDLSSSSTTVSNRTEPNRTFGYIEPEFQTTGELTPESDVYSFGIILLRLLTGRPALDLTNDVQWALDTRELKSLLDYTAGDWPYVQAQQLAHLGLRCAEANCRNRPDLGLEVWRVLELMGATSGGASMMMVPLILNELSIANSLSQYISEFSLAEIEEATSNFHSSLKIGEGGYGCVYKGQLGHTEVAIKKPHFDDSWQGSLEYQQEIKVLGKLRHPNLITLIGTCREVGALVYEYLPNGSLEDRLSCKDNSSPLSWQTRIRIAAELCSVLVFLHSSKPHSMVHGDLIPDNILLDANLVSKLSGFGSSRVISHDDDPSSSSTTVSNRTEPKRTFGYIEPEFQTMGELTSESDVYSFGIILLRLLTGRPALDLKNEVQRALDNRELKSLLDYTAGDWPYIQAQQMAHLGLRCAEANRRNRPDLGLEVWRVLELMRATSGGASSSLRLLQAPSYFICPILMDVMQDPHVAADGFTYEAEALRGWLDSGHDTSPMTNVQLEHTNLVPNLALRSAIREWQQQQ